MTVDRALQNLITAQRKAVICLVRCYQATLSGLVGRQCRFTPTCSEYFIEAVETQGVFRGGLKGLWRIARCNPWGKSGYDPVSKPNGGASE
jgi:putative membrane protein insertion efficiency factor